MEKEIKWTIGAFVVIILATIYLWVFHWDVEYFVTCMASEIAVRIATLVGVVGGAYPAIRAVVRLAGGPLFPAIPLPGQWIVKCAILAILGLIIGLIAPLWAAACWALGSAILIMTKGIE